MTYRCLLPQLSIPEVAPEKAPLHKQRVGCCGEDKQPVATWGAVCISQTLELGMHLHTEVVKIAKQLGYPELFRSTQHSYFSPSKRLATKQAVKMSHN